MATEIKNSFLNGKAATHNIAGSSGGGGFYRHTNSYIGITPSSIVGSANVKKFCDVLQDKLFEMDGPEIVVSTSSKTNAVKKDGKLKPILQVTSVQIHFADESESGPSDATLKKYFAMTLKAINAIK